jgi:hypothetical protein
VTIRGRGADGGMVLWDGLVFDDTQNRLAQLDRALARGARELSRHLQSVREEEKAALRARFTTSWDRCSPR